MTLSQKTKRNIKATCERAVRAASASALALIGTNTADWTHLHPSQVASAAGGAALVSLLISLSSIGLSGDNGPSITKAETTDPVVAPPVA